MIQPQHELIQPAGEGEHWNDSLYFNFFSGDGDVAGFTRVGVLPNTRRVTAGLVAAKGGGPFAGMLAGDAKLPDSDWDNFEVGGLRYRMVEPLRRWAVELDSPTGRASLEFEALAPAFDYSTCPVRLPEQVASGHYEQHCRVGGWIEGPGVRHEIDGFGQRDHSWGIRDWSGVRSWRWLQAIFGEDLAFNVFSVEQHFGETATSGYLYEAGESRAIERASIHTDYDSDGHAQRAVSLELEDTRGVRRTITAERFGLLPINLGHTTVNEGLFRWQLDGRAGFGMYEYLFQAEQEGQEAG